MQRHIPFGYCVAQGKAQIDPENSQVVQAIYTAYAFFRKKEERGTSGKAI